MEFSYGQGVYVEGKKRLEGRIILSEHKLYLRGPEGDLAQTYIPLEKIEKVKKNLQGLEIQVRPSLTFRYTTILKGENKHLLELIKDIVQRRGLKKKFLKNEWIEETA